MVRLRSPAPYGGFPERPKGADCKSVVTDFGGPNPPSPTNKNHCKCSGFLFGGNGGEATDARTRQPSPLYSIKRFLQPSGAMRREDVVTNPPSPTKQKTHFCLPTKVRFLNDVCLRQMMLASPMMTATPNDVCLTAHWANIASLRPTGATSF